MSQNSGLSHLLWRFLRPEIDELVLYSTAAILIVGVAMYQLAVNGDIGTDSTDIISSFSNAISSTSLYLSRGTGWASFFLFGFWFIIGGIIYTLVWAISTIVIDIRNDLRISESFVHPRSFHKSDFWASIIARTAVRAIASIALIFYVVFWLWVFAPVAVSAAIRFFNNARSFSNILDMVLSLIGIIITLHIVTVLIRLAMLRPSADNEDHLLH